MCWVDPFTLAFGAATAKAGGGGGGISVARWDLNPGGGGGLDGMAGQCPFRVDAASGAEGGSRLGQLWSSIRGGGGGGGGLGALAFTALPPHHRQCVPQACKKTHT